MARYTLMLSDGSTVEGHSMAEVRRAERRAEEHIRRREQHERGLYGLLRRDESHLEGRYAGFRGALKGPG